MKQVSFMTATSRVSEVIEPFRQDILFMNPKKTKNPNNLIARVSQAVWLITRLISQPLKPQLSTTGL